MQHHALLTAAGWVDHRLRRITRKLHRIIDLNDGFRNPHTAAKLKARGESPCLQGRKESPCLPDSGNVLKEEQADLAAIRPDRQPDLVEQYNGLVFELQPRRHHERDAENPWTRVGRHLFGSSR